jgi:amino acid transporter
MNDKPETKGFHKGVASLMLGLVGLFLNYLVPTVVMCFPIMVGAIVGIILGIASMRDASEGKTAGVIGIIISVILILLFVVGFGIGMGQAVRSV